MANTQTWSKTLLDACISVLDSNLIITDFTINIFVYNVKNAVRFPGTALVFDKLAYTDVSAQKPCTVSKHGIIGVQLIISKYYSVECSIVCVKAGV